LRAYVAAMLNGDVLLCGKFDQPDLVAIAFKQIGQDLRFLRLAIRIAQSYCVIRLGVDQRIQFSDERISMKPTGQWIRKVDK
jgi:hypothetical protein